jgi:hypothetical protein
MNNEIAHWSNGKVTCLKSSDVLTVVNNALYVNGRKFAWTQREYHLLMSVDPQGCLITQSLINQKACKFAKQHIFGEYIEGQN